MRLALIMALWSAGVIGALLALGAALFVRPDADRAAVLRAYSLADSTFLTLPDGAVAHVRIDGPTNGAPIVLLHGFASSAWAWDGWNADLARDHRVIRIDLLGHGLTQMAPGAGLWRPDQARFLEQTLDALHIDKTIIAGNSMGGSVAWSFAATHPARVRALILIDSAGPAPDGPPPRVRDVLRAWYAPLIRTGLRWAGGTILMRASMQSGVSPSHKLVEAEVKRTDLFWRLHRAELLAGFATLRAGEPPPLSLVVAPTLVLQGGRDRLVPRAVAETLAHGIRRARLIVYPDLAHTPHQEDPARTVADARAFLAGQGV